MFWFRQTDPRWPFLWDSDDQPAARWHGNGEGPVQYLADTPDGAWAEFLRQERVSDPEALETVDRSLWAIDVPEQTRARAQPRLSRETLRGGLETYPACRGEARRLRLAGARALEAPSAALVDGAARGQHVRDGFLVEADPREGRVLVLFGPQPDLRGWLCSEAGRPSPRLLDLVRPL